MDRLVWIDTNMDGIFSTNELVMNELNAQNLTKVDTVAVSATQQLGTTRMRIGVTYAGTQLNPSVTFLGVFRDYTINYPMDTVKPTAVLRGGQTVYTEINKTYNDSGIVAIDNIEGNISSKYQIIGSVDNTKVGPNYIKYIVRDLYGNVSDTLYRTVFVILNQTGPSIQLAGPTQMYVEVYNKFNEPGYTALDNNGGNLTNQVIITSNLDTAKLGQYTITYTIIDGFGLSATAQRTITVGDTTKPVITPVANPYAHQVGTAIDLTKLFILRDNYWPITFISGTPQGTVNVNGVGSYFISLQVIDGSGNQSEKVTVRVDVKDTKAPELTLIGDNPLVWSVKIPFVDPGVDVRDNFWPKNTLVVTKRGTVNVNFIGDYTIWYICSDPSGNKDSVSRLVQVRDITKPIIDLLGINEVNLPRWKEYVDPPVAIVDNYNSDASLRGFLVITNSLPKNAQGNHFGDVEGLFSVSYVVRDSSGNVSDIKKRDINVMPPLTGSEEYSNLPTWLNVFPNPSEGVVKIYLSEKQNAPLLLQLMDMQGKQVWNSEVSGSQFIARELDLTQISKGIYILKIGAGEQHYYMKLQLK
jgi:hypothetical protein